MPGTITTEILKNDSGVWKMRNDSTSISAILAPNNYSSEAEKSNSPSETADNPNPRRLTIYSSKYRRNQKNPKAHCESCYCREPSEKPILRLKLSSLFEDEDACYKHPKRKHCQKSYCCKLVPDDILERHSQEILDKVHDEVRYAPKSVFLKKLQEESHKNCDDCPCAVERLAYTEQRQEYENVQPLYEQDYAVGRLKSKEDVERGEVESKDENKSIDKNCAFYCVRSKENLERAHMGNQNTDKEYALQRLRSKEKLEKANIENQDIDKSCDACCQKANELKPENMENQDVYKGIDRVSSIDEKVDDANELKNKTKISLSSEDSQHCNCCKCKSRFVILSNKNINEIQQFRDENYFETHSSSNLMGANGRSNTQNSLGQKDHECVHKFILNDRKLPEPVNCDAYGVSRCVICNKPMERPNLKGKKPDSRIRMKEEKSKKDKIVPSYKDITLVPRTVSIGSGKERIELQVPMKLIINEEEEEEEKHKKVVKKRRPVPASTFALRYQKGVV